ncbi:MAG: sugar transporter [Paracoccaceae bacterium]
MSHIIEAGRRLFVSARDRAYVLVGAITFLLLVAFPVAGASYYLFFVAEDQYSSNAAFSVRSEEGGSVAQGFLGVISSVSGTGSAQDLDLLHDFIRSQAIIDVVSQSLNLRRIFAKRGDDFYFSLADDAPIEDLVEYWRRMVSVSNEARNGILHVEVRAFDPRDAQAISQAVIVASSELINQLSNDARTDSLRLSQELVEEARANVQNARRALTEFRRANRIVSPELELETSRGVIAALQTELAETLVSREEVMRQANAGDPRVSAMDNRIKALRSQIDSERNMISQANLTAAVDVYGLYEGLLLDQEMQNAAYAQALTNLSVAHSDARRQARYLAVHVPPTLAETPIYPERSRSVLVIAAVMFLIWSIFMIFYRNARDKF